MKHYTIPSRTLVLAVVSILALACSDTKKPEAAPVAIQKITPSLWIEKDAKAVADYYLSIFKEGKLKDFRRFNAAETGNEAGLETAVIEIA